MAKYLRVIVDVIDENENIISPENAINGFVTPLNEKEMNKLDFNEFHYRIAQFIASWKPTHHLREKYFPDIPYEGSKLPNADSSDKTRIYFEFASLHIEYQTTKKNFLPLKTLQKDNVQG